MVYQPTKQLVVLYREMFCHSVVFMDVHLHSSDFECAKNCDVKSSCKAMQVKNGTCLIYEDLTQVPCGQSTYVVTA